MSTLRPVHDLCVSKEAVRAGQMLLSLQEQKATIYKMNTDSCPCRLPEKAKLVLKNITFKDLRLRARFKTKQCLNQCYDPCVPDGDLEVYRAAEATQEDLLKMDPGLPKSAWFLAIPPMQWRELSEADPAQAVLAKQMHCTGNCWNK